MCIYNWYSCWLSRSSLLIPILILIFSGRQGSQSPHANKLSRSTVLLYIQIPNCDVQLYILIFPLYCSVCFALVNKVLIQTSNKNKSNQTKTNKNQPTPPPKKTPMKKVNFLPLSNRKNQLCTLASPSPFLIVILAISFNTSHLLNPLLIFTSFLFITGRINLGTACVPAQIL